MAEDEIEAAVETPAPATTEGEPAVNGDGKKPRRPREPEVPVEELFDLSKPIPKADRPDKVAHEKELDELNAEFEKAKTEREAVQAEIEQKLNANKGGEMGKQRDILQGLRKEKGRLIEEKKVIRSKLDSLRTEADKLVKEKRDTGKSVGKFNSVADIDAEIKKLTRKQETTSMSLSQEKKLIQEINVLKKSKDLVADLKSKDSSLDSVKEQRKIIATQIGAKDSEIDAVQKEIEVHQGKIKALSDKETDKREVLNALFTKRDELRKAIGEIIKKKDAIRDTFRQVNNDWFNYQRAIRAQKKMRYEEEKKAREEAEAEWRKKKEEEEAKKIPYEAEQALCDHLADYLTRTYLQDAEEEKKKAEEAALAKKNASIVAVKDDPFAGMTAMKKKDEDGQYFGKGKGKKKRNRPSKEKKVTASSTFTLSVDSFEQFGLLQLDPPVKIEQVPKSVEELKAKKKWYSEQPRGSVPTATEIRKANEKAAAKLRQKSKSGSSGNKFALSDADFAPLGAGSTASVPSTWGQQPKADDEAAAPEESSEAATEAPEPAEETAA
eukprot:CAMPEP_0194046970 /NCGR_PEP_ID=MMETSP0009_2-20130614/23231_1 /TAXON_ID=210454 /ORGANISM="Grammatophora oceanica, Strain CCMP 410" /LENGTH=551 /DNA_ID=CAMNT_0038692461 /DNA_START=20 /DNA_END=1675 /DNA_ORIENTATION=+